MMGWAHAWLSEFSGWWWPGLANHLWQATLFTALVALLVRSLLARAPARVRYRVWLLAAAKFAVPAALAAAVAGSLGADASSLMTHSADAPRRALAVLRFVEPVARVAEPVAAAGPAQDGAHAEAYCALTLAWAGGAALCLGSWLARRRALARRIKRAAGPATEREADAFDRAQARLKAGRRARLALIEGVAEPGVWGVLSPLTVLPAGVARELTDGELEAVLLHELAHVRRRDNLAGNLHMLLCCLFWFHPLVWLIDRRLLAERERACDEEVLRLGVPRETYAAAIAKVCRLCLGGGVAGVSRASGAGLKNRVEEIMRDRRRVSLLHRASVASAAALLVAATVAGGLFSRGNVSAAGRLYRRLAEFPYELKAVRGQDPKARTRMRMGSRTEPNTPAPELYSEKLTLQIMLVNLPGSADAASQWEGSYRLYFVSETEERRVIDAKVKELAPNGGAVAFDVEPSDYKEKILLGEGKFKKAGLATPQDRIVRVDNIVFKERVPEAQRTQRGKLMTVYSVRVYDARLKMPVLRANEWMASVFDEDAGGGGRLLPRTTVYANFFVSPKGDMFVSQWARDTKDIEW